MVHVALLMVLFVLGGGTAFSVEEDARPAGAVKTLSGRAFVERAGQRLELELGDPVFPQDSLETGADGILGVLFRDDTRLTLGPRSHLTLDSFTFDPAASNLSFVARLARGVFAYISGKIAKISSDRVRLETPTATIGLRGTRCLIRVVEP